MSDRPNVLGDRMPRWWWKAVAVFWLGAAALLFGRWIFSRLHTVLMILLVSFFLSLAIEPAVNTLARRGWRRGAATGVVMLGVVIALAIFFGAIGTLVVRQVGNFIDSAPAYVKDIESWVNRTFHTDIDADSIIADITRPGGPVQNFATSLAGNTLKFGTTALGYMLQSFSILLFTFYMVADGPRLRRTICSVFRPEVQVEVLRAWDTAIDKTGGYLYSRALLALLSAVAHTIFFNVIHVDYPVALGIWVGIVSQFIPVVGTYLAGLLPIIIALVSGDPIDALWVLGFVVIYQQIENYVFAPRISARTMELHPAVAFGAAIVGGALIGPVGALLAMPAAASIQAFVILYVRRHDVEDHPLTSATPPARSWGRRRKKDEDGPTPEEVRPPASAG
jgi:predicted PurR-regulated permease PerM